MSYYEMFMLTKCCDMIQQVYNTATETDYPPTRVDL